MPYEISKDAEACSASEPWAVKKSDTGEVVGCHETEEDAQAHLQALQANVEDARSETRTIDVDVEDLDTRGRTLHGFAIVYGAEARLNGFRERFARGAFRDVLDGDVRALLNHDENQVLGRTRSGTLRLFDEQRGLRFEIDLPSSPLGENVREAVRRKDIDGASFHFVAGRESWQGDLRTVEQVKAMKDITIATYPAYETGSVELRTRNNDGAEGRQKGSAMAEEANKEGGLQVEDRHDKSEERARPPAGSLRVEDRTADAPVRFQSLADLYAERASSRTARPRSAGTSTARSRGRPARC